jgi:hypothetical protein
MEPDLQSSSTARQRLVLPMNTRHSPTFMAEVPGYAEPEVKGQDQPLDQTKRR